MILLTIMIVHNARVSCIRGLEYSREVYGSEITLLPMILLIIMIVHNVRVFCIRGLEYSREVYGSEITLLLMILLIIMIVHNVRVFCIRGRYMENVSRTKQTVFKQSLICTQLFLRINWITCVNKLYNILL
jgi:hypothetical protein